MPEFQSAKFGELVFGDKAFNEDIVVSTSGEAKPRDDRPNNHELSLAELKNYIDPRTRKVIVGRGFSGVLEVAADARRFLAEKGIALSESSSQEAIRQYNQEKDKSTVTAIIHSTC